MLHGLPRGYTLHVPFPPGSGELVLKLNNEPIRAFPYGTTDATVIAIARLHKRFGVFNENAL